jgi:hypothetical protein
VSAYYMWLYTTRNGPEFSNPTSLSALLIRSLVDEWHSLFVAVSGFALSRTLS